MRYSDLQVDMAIKHRATGRTAIVAKVEKGKFQIVDSNGHPETLDRYYAGEWEKR